MRVLILNGSNQDDATADLICSILISELQKNSNSIEHINLWDKKIASCRGCLRCWIKTPGICVTDDEARQIARAVVQSNLFITISPISFGGYSYQLKKALDRLLPVISPFFRKFQGEVHHHPRYARFPKSISIGILTEEDQEMVDIFNNLIIRNAINLHYPVYLSSVILSTLSPAVINDEINRLLEVVRSPR